MYRCLNGAAPRYLTELATLPVIACGRHHLLISSYVVQQLAIARSLLLAQKHGTAYLLLSAPLQKRMNE